MRNLAQRLKQTWEQEKKEKMDALQRMFERSLGSVGDGHRAASSQVRSGRIGYFCRLKHILWAISWLLQMYYSLEIVLWLNF